MSKNVTFRKKYKTFKKPTIIQKLKDFEIIYKMHLRSLCKKSVTLKVKKSFERRFLLTTSIVSIITSIATSVPQKSGRN